MAAAGAHSKAQALRDAWVEIDLDAIEGNVVQLVARAAPAGLLAVVKADAYGHGAVEVARAAVSGGASWLGVALVEEGLALRDAGISDVPILVLSEPPIRAAAAVVEGRLTPTVYTERGIDALAKAAARAGLVEALPVHLKVDTGMHRVGCDVHAAVGLAEAVMATGSVSLEGLFTHLAVADDPSDPATCEQLTAFELVRVALAARGIEPRYVHARNSAALLSTGTSDDLVRCGIALYGVPPAPGLDGGLALQPALSLKARASYLKRLAAGERLSYGLRYRLDVGSVVATVPLGYADGVPRRLSEVGGEVLALGVRRPIAGTITMDQILVDLCDDLEPDDEIVLLGRQGPDEISAWEWADRLGTIPYEVLCGISPRVPRRYLGGPAR